MPPHPLRPLLPRQHPQPHHHRTFTSSPPSHATLIPRPHRPYTFTQLVTLSDGSTFTQRTTSPVPLYRSTRDTRNSVLWNPSDARMASVEEDEAGRLRAFRRRFGRGWDSANPDADTPDVAGDGNGEGGAGRVDGGEGETATEAARGEVQLKREAEGDGWSDEAEDNLLDLISSYGREAEASGEAKGSTETAKGTGKGGSK